MNKRNVLAVCTLVVVAAGAAASPLNADAHSRDLTARSWAHVIPAAQIYRHARVAASGQVGSKNTPAAAEILTGGAFEGSTGKWTQRTKAGHHIIVTYGAHSPKHAAHLCGYSRCTDTLSQVIKLPTDARQLELGYWVNVTRPSAAGCNDKLTVSFQSVDGHTTSPVQVVCSTGAPHGYAEHTSDVTAMLAPFSSQAVRLILRAQVGAPRRTAFFIDDVSLESLRVSSVAQPPAAPPTATVPPASSGPQPIEAPNPASTDTPVAPPGQPGVPSQENTATPNPGIAANPPGGLPTLTPTAVVSLPAPTATSASAPGKPAPAPTSTPSPQPGPAPTSTQSPQPRPAPTATATPVVVATSKPQPRPTATKTPLPLPTNTPVALPTATSTPRPAPTATNTPLPLPTATNTPIPLPTATNTPVPTNTPLPLPTNTPLPVATKPPAPTPTATTIGSGGTGSGCTDCLSQMLTMLNNDRAANGVPALSLNGTQTSGSGTCVGSQGHSVAMQQSGSIWHTNPSYPAASFPNNICIPYMTAGENVGNAGGSELNALQNLDAMMMSEPHDSGTCASQINHACNIINSNYHQVGIGLVYVNNIVWLTEDFTN